VAGSNPTVTVTGTGFVGSPAFATTGLPVWHTTVDSDTQLTAVQLTGTPVAGAVEGWVELNDGSEVSNHLPFTWT
jgi:hypothetical protein